MKNKRLSKIALNSSQNQLHLKQCWRKDAMASLNHWGINEKMTLCITLTMSKNIITSKFKENLWCEENLAVKRKLRYYKEVINPNLEDQNGSN